jgi:hypothetical protein
MSRDKQEKHTSGVKTPVFNDCFIAGDESPAYRPEKPMPRLVVFALPFRVRSLEVFYAVFLEVPESGGYFVDQIVIVRN